MLAAQQIKIFVTKSSVELDVGQIMTLNFTGGFSLITCEGDEITRLEKIFFVLYNLLLYTLMKSQY